MRKVKVFFKAGTITGLAAFGAFVIIGSLIHFCWNPFSWSSVIGGAIGCGLGTGFMNAVFAVIND